MSEINCTSQVGGAVRDMVAEIIQEQLREFLAIDWPSGRLGLCQHEVARSLGVDVQQIGNATRRGELSPTRVGKRLIYTRSDVLEWLIRKQEPCRVRR